MDAESFGQKFRQLSGLYMEVRREADFACETLENLIARNGRAIKHSYLPAESNMILQSSANTVLGLLQVYLSHYTMKLFFDLAEAVADEEKSLLARKLILSSIDDSMYSNLVLLVSELENSTFITVIDPFGHSGIYVNEAIENVQLCVETLHRLIDALDELKSEDRKQETVNV